MSSVRNAIAAVYMFFRPGKPVSRKVITSLLTSAFIYLATLAVTKKAGHLDEVQRDLIAVCAANLAGFCAGWLRKEFPEIVSDGPAELQAPTSLKASKMAEDTTTLEGIPAAAPHPVDPGSPPPASTG